jgi:branched-chain amino acid transport system ATP-binding protein
MSSEAPLLEVAGLSAFYGEARVLDEISFTLPGGSAAIVGRNGMGKTTLCRAIMGIAPPDSEGSVLLDGRELGGEP